MCGSRSCCKRKTGERRERRCAFLKKSAQKTLYKDERRTGSLSVFLGGNGRRLRRDWVGGVMPLPTGEVAAKPTERVRRAVPWCRRSLHAAIGGISHRRTAPIYRIVQRTTYRISARRKSFTVAAGNPSPSRRNRFSTSRLCKIWGKKTLDLFPCIWYNER